jgi:hypothetical protein
MQQDVLESDLHLIECSRSLFVERHVALQASQSVGTASPAEIERQAVRTLAALNAMRMALDTYEGDILLPLLHRQREQGV